MTTTRRFIVWNAIGLGIFIFTPIFRIRFTTTLIIFFIFSLFVCVFEILKEIERIKARLPQILTREEKIKSYICTVSIELKDKFIRNIVKREGYNLKKDFDFANYRGHFSFSEVLDLVSGLNFINVGGHIYTDPSNAGYIYFDLRFKNGDQNLVEDHFFKIALQGDIYFITKKMNEEFGEFPYGELLSHLKYLHETGFTKEKEKNKIQEGLLTKDEFKEWKLSEAREQLEFDTYANFDRQGYDYRFESDYAFLHFHFEPYTGEHISLLSGTKYDYNSLLP
jgi:hypothetical protein